MNITEFVKLPVNEIKKNLNNLDVEDIQDSGTLTQIFLHIQDTKVLNHYLSLYPKLINDRHNNISLVEHLIDRGYTTLLKNHSPHIDLTQPATGGNNIATYLIKKGNCVTLSNILHYHPNDINECGSNGIYPAIALADSGYTTVLKTYAAHIDLTLTTHDQYNICTYLIKKGLIVSLSNILHYNPKLINHPDERGIYPVEYMAIEGYTNILKTYAAYIDLSLPASGQRNLCTYLISRDLINSLSNILHHNPQIINQCEESGIYPVQYLVDKGYTSLMKTYASYIDLTLDSSSGSTLACYLLNQQYTTTLKNILHYSPHALNAVGRDGKSLAEQLANNKNKTLINEYKNYINTELECSRGLTLREHIYEKLNIALEPNYSFRPVTKKHDGNFNIKETIIQAPEKQSTKDVVLDFKQQLRVKIRATL